MRLTCKEQGFTLIELLITFALVGFILASIYTFYLTGLRSWQRGDAFIEAQQSARIAIDIMVTELRYASEISLHNNNREVRFKIDPDTRIRRFRIMGKELVYESFPTGSFNYFHNKVAIGIEEIEFELKHNNLLNISLTAEVNNCRIILSDSIRPRNLTWGD